MNAFLKVLVFFPKDNNAPYVFTAIQELTALNRKVIQKTVTAALQAAKTDMPFDNVLTNDDIEILLSACSFTKTVNLYGDMCIQIVGNVNRE